MMPAECTCSSGLFFWHEPECALMTPPRECPRCGCTGYHALRCDLDQPDRSQ